MKKAERVLVAMAALGAILDLLHVTGASLLIALGAALLSLLYVFLGFALLNDIGLKGLFKKASYGIIPRGRVPFSIVIGALLFFAVLGVLFRFQLWPGAALFLRVSASGLLVILVVALVEWSNSVDPFYSRVLFRVIPFGALVALFLFLPKRTILTWHFPDHPGYVEAAAAAAEDPANETLQLREEEEWQKVVAADELN